MLRSKSWLLVLASGLLLSAWPTGASAGPLTLKLEDLGTGASETVVDTDGDNIVTYFGTVGGFYINFTTGFSSSGLGLADSAILDLNSLNVSTSLSGGTLRLSLEATDYTATKETLTASAYLGGNLLSTAGSTVEANAWVNTANESSSTAGYFDDTNTNTIQFLGATFGPGAFSASDYETFTTSGLFSLFSQVTIRFTGPGLVSVDLASAAHTPEPGTLVLFGSGLLAAARLARRRRPSA
jgi:hypothetical protein